MVEVKPASDDAWITADSAQVSRYWERYRLVLATNTRDFVLLGEDSQGKPAKLETFRLADSAADFEAKLQQPSRPRQQRWARRWPSTWAAPCPTGPRWPNPATWPGCWPPTPATDLTRVEASGDASSLNAVRSALEEALGVRFEGERGAAFFRSTLVQTLFLRRLLGLGAVGAADSGSGGTLRLAHLGLAPARSRSCRPCFSR